MRRINYPALFFLLLAVVLAVFLFQAKKAQSQRYDSSAIMHKISYIKELSLVKYNYNGVIAYKQSMKLMNIDVPLTEKSFLIKYNGYVRAGIDMKNVSVDVDGKTVKVHLPKPVVQETVIDEKKMTIYDESMNILNPISIADYQKAIVAEKEKITKDALAQGILTESSDQAHKFITSVLKELGFDKIEIDEVNTITVPAVKEIK